MDYTQHKHVPGVKYDNSGFNTIDKDEKWLKKVAQSDVFCRWCPELSWDYLHIFVSIFSEVDISMYIWVWSPQ